jgi:hypothetical protein
MDQYVSEHDLDPERVPELVTEVMNPSLMKLHGTHAFHRPKRNIYYGAVPDYSSHAKSLLHDVSRDHTAAQQLEHIAALYHTIGPHSREGNYLFGKDGYHSQLNRYSTNRGGLGMFHSWREPHHNEYDGISLEAWHQNPFMVYNSYTDRMVDITDAVRSRYPGQSYDTGAQVSVDGIAYVYSHERGWEMVSNQGHFFDDW